MKTFALAMASSMLLLCAPAFAASASSEGRACVNILCAKGTTSVCVKGKAKCVATRASSVSVHRSSSSAKAKVSSTAKISKKRPVMIQQSAFSPRGLIVVKGTTVTWTNFDSVTHTITSDKGGPNSSGELKKGQSYSYTFDTPGNFFYHCSIHPSMVAGMTVEE